MPEQLTAEQKLAQLVELKNKVLEGGGAKGVVLCDAVALKLDHPVVDCLSIPSSPVPTNLVDALAHSNTGDLSPPMQADSLLRQGCALTI